MFKSKSLAVATVALLGVTAQPAVAHHSFAAYDSGQKVVLEGTVKQFLWQNPHSHIVVTVPKGAGSDAASTEWDVEAPAPNIMSRQGWNKQTLKAGDHIKMMIRPMRDASYGGAMMFALVNGTTMYGDASRPPEAAAFDTKPAAAK